MANYKALFKNIKGFAFDVDGVFTDGNVYLFPGPEFIRSMNIKDGYAIQHCVKMGYRVAIITGGTSKQVRERFQNLGVTDIYMHSIEKYNDYEDFRMKYHFEHDDLLFMGDDLPDYRIMQSVGLPACPSDAAIEIKKISKYISDKKGGEGCVRDVIEQTLRLHDKWMVDESFTW